jgi:hypothetical protein
LGPSFDRARNRDALNPIGRHFLETLTGKKRGCQAAGSRSGSIQAYVLPSSGVPIEDEQIPTQPIHHRLHHSKHGAVEESAVTRAGQD